MPAMHNDHHLAPGRSNLEAIPYHTWTFLSLNKYGSIPWCVQPPEIDRGVELPQVGGLLYRYKRRATWSENSISPKINLTVGHGLTGWDEFLRSCAEKSTNGYAPCYVLKSAAHFEMDLLVGQLGTFRPLFEYSITRSMHHKIRVLWVLRYVFPHDGTNNVYPEAMLSGQVESSFC